MKKTVCCVLVLLAASGLLFAGGGKQSSDAGGVKTVSFHYWQQEQQAGIENMINLFMRANPNIKVEMTLIPQRDPYYTRLQASLPVGTGPDIMTHNSNIADYLNYLYTLDEHIPNSSIDLSKFPKVIIDFYTFGGKLYAIPKDFDTIAIFYNKAMFDKAGVPYPKAGWTWDEFRETAQKLTQGGVHGFACDWNDAQVGFGNFVRQARGGPVHNPARGVNVNDTTMVEALEFIRRLMYTDKVGADASILSETNASDLFVSERVAMISHGSWTAPTHINALGANKVGIAELPKGRNQGVQINGLGFALNKGTKNFPEAFKLLEFLASKEGQAATAKVVIPAYDGAADEWLSAFPQVNLRVFLDSVRFSFTEAPYPKNSRATNVILIDHIAGINLNPTLNIKAELDKAQAAMLENLK